MSLIFNATAAPMVDIHTRYGQETISEFVDVEILGAPIREGLTTEQAEVLVSFIRGFSAPIILVTELLNEKYHQLGNQTEMLFLDSTDFYRENFHNVMFPIQFNQLDDSNPNTFNVVTRVFTHDNKTATDSYIFRPDDENVNPTISLIRIKIRNNCYIALRITGAKSTVVNRELIIPLVSTFEDDRSIFKRMALNIATLD